ncbi:MAG: MBL fold metallo-hydrolase [Hyphomicrobiales bacterium]
MNNSIALLGTKGGPAIRPGSAMPTSCLLNLAGKQIVIDCGLGVTRGLVDQGMALTDLELIIITHLHSDHYLELGPLLHTAWMAGLSKRVRIIGPEGLDIYWEHFYKSMLFDIELRLEDEGRVDLNSLVDISVLQEGSFLDEDGVKGAAVKNVHPPIDESYALRFDAGGKSVFFSGDTAFHPPLAEIARGVDVLVHEAMLGPAVDALCARIGNADERLKVHLLRAHTLAEDVAKLAVMAEAKSLALNHLIPTDDPDFSDLDWLEAVRVHWHGDLHIGKDGMVIPF